MKKILVISYLLGLWVALIAQPTGTVSGYIKDAKTGEPLIGATVQIDSTDFGATTDFNGFYEITDIPTKTYNFTASYLGYKPITRFNYVVKSAGNIDLNFELQEASVELEGVVVRPDPFQKSRETPLSVQKLTTEEIVSYPGGNNDIAKVIQSLPGVGASVGGFRNDVIIRGGAPNEVVYFLDGIEVPNINHFSTQGSGGGPVSLLNVSFFEGVSLTSSAFSAQYDNVLSGVLQFDQRTGNNRERQTNIRISGNEAALTTEGPLFKGSNKASNASYIVSVRRSYLQLLFQLLDLPFLPSYWDFQLKLNHKIDDYNEINIIGLGAIDNFSINVPEDLSDEARFSLDQSPIIEQWSNTTGISWRRRFKDGTGFWRNALSVSIFNNNLKRFEDNESELGLFFENDSRETEVKLRSELTRYVGQWKLAGGFTIQNINYNTQTLNTTDAIEFSTAIDYLRYGIFAQATRPILSDRASLSVGFRMDANTFTSNGDDLLNTFSPRVALSVNLDNQDRWKFNASAGRYYKAPQNTILGFRDRNNKLVNQDAQYIHSDHLVAGFEFIPRVSTRFTIEVFYKRYKNYPVSLIDQVSLANLGGDFTVFGNEAIASVGLGRSYGVEVLAQQKLTKNIFAILSYTYFRSEFTGLDTDNYLPSAWDNRYLLSFTGGYKFGNNWELGLKFRYLGSVPFAPVDIEATTPVYPDIIRDYSQLGDRRLEAFNALDIRINKKWNFTNWSFDVFLDIQNLYAADNPEPPVYVLDRNEEGQITEPRQLVEVTDVETGQILPTIGIIIDF